MRRLTPLRTMRRLWCDASAAASEVGLEFGTCASDRENQANGASGGKRARQVLLREGRRAESYEVLYLLFSARPPVFGPELTDEGVRAKSYEGSRRWRITIRYLGHGPLLQDIDHVEEPFSAPQEPRPRKPRVGLRRQEQARVRDALGVR